MLSPLQLKNLSFKTVCLEVDPDGTFEAAPRFNQNLSFAVLDNQRRFYRLNLELDFDGAPEKPFAYSGRFSVIGIFEVSADFPEDRLVELVRVNGGGLLYGAIRDMILTISSRSLKGGFLLPTLNFQEVLKAAAISGNPRQRTKRLPQQQKTN